MLSDWVNMAGRKYKTIIESPPDNNIDEDMFNFIFYIDIILTVSIS